MNRFRVLQYGFATSGTAVAASLIFNKKEPLPPPEEPQPWHSVGRNAAWYIIGITNDGCVAVTKTTTYYALQAWNAGAPFVGMKVVELTEHPWFSVGKDTVEVTSVAAASGVAAAKTGYIGLCLIGFKKAGVAAKSMAAAYQSSVGNVAAGSLFAKLQSVGATGGFAVFGPVGAGAVVVVGGAFAYYKYNQRCIRHAEQEKQRLAEQERKKELGKGSFGRNLEVMT